MQLVQRPSGQTVGGEIRFNTGDHVYNVVNTPTSVMQKLRGNYMSMIFPGADDFLESGTSYRRAGG